MRLRGTEEWLTGLCVAVAALVLCLVIVSPAAAEKGKLLERLTPDEKYLAALPPMALAA